MKKSFKEKTGKRYTTYRDILNLNNENNVTHSFNVIHFFIPL